MSRASLDQRKECLPLDLRHIQPIERRGAPMRVPHQPGVGEPADEGVAGEEVEEHGMVSGEW